MPEFAEVRPPDKGNHITEEERRQLARIDTAKLDEEQWVYLSELDQTLRQGSDINVGNIDSYGKFKFGDGDTYLYESADDVVDFVLAGASGEFALNINGAEDFTFTANALNILSGSNIVMADDAWIGLGASAARIEFDNQTADEINFLDCNIGIGTQTPGYKFHLVDAFSGIGAYRSHYNILDYTATSSATAYGEVMHNRLDIDAGGFSMANVSTALTNALQMEGSGTIAQATPFYSLLYSLGGDSTDLTLGHGARITLEHGGSGTIADYRGVFIEDASTGTVTAKWGLYVESAFDNYIGGDADILGTLYIDNISEYTGAAGITFGHVFGGVTGSTIGNLTLADGSITDSGGSITFNDENLSTTGTFGCGVATLGDTSTLATSAAPVADAQIANKKYVDDNATSPGGADTQMQYNNGGAFGAVPELSYDDANLFLIHGTDKEVEVHTFTDTGVDTGINTLGAEGGEVKLVEGSYVCDAVSTIDQDNTTISGGGAGTILDASGWVQDADVIYSTGKNYQYIRDMKFLGNTGGGATGKYFINSLAGSYGKFMNNWFVDADDEAIYIDNNFAIVAGNHTINSDSYGIWLKSSDHVACYGNVCDGDYVDGVRSESSYAALFANTHEGCGIFSSGSYSICMGNTVESALSTIAGVQMSSFFGSAIGNCVVTSGYGVRVGQDHQTITANTAYLCGVDNFRIDNNMTEIALVGNVGDQAGNTYNDMHFYGNNNYCLAVGNILTSAAGRSERAIYTVSGDRCVFGMNVSYGHDTCGIETESGSDYNIIAFNAGGEEIILNSDNNVVYAVDQTVTNTGSNNIVVNHTTGTDINYNCAVSVGGVINADGGKVAFPAAQSASADANTLDDYEEGTWTAAFAVDSGTITINTDYDTGSYTKVGRMVHVHGRFRVSSVDVPVGGVTITGLPFAAASLSEEADFSTAAVYMRAAGTAVPNGVTGYAGNGASTITLVENSTTGAGNDLGVHFAAGTMIMVSLTYATT